MTTKQNIEYFEQEWTGGVPLPSLSKANMDAYDTVKELTDDFSDMSQITEDPAFEQMFGNLCDALRRASGGGPAPKKKSQSANTKAHAAKSVKQARGRKQVKKTRKADYSAFVEKMRAARAAKQEERAKTEESSEKKARSGKKSAACTKQSTAKPEKTKQPTKSQIANDEYEAAEKTGTLSEEVKQIRKFISLVKKSTKDKLISAVKGLNKVISERKITKQSPYADEIRRIQFLLIGATRQAPYKVEVGEGELAKFVKIAGGHRVYKTVEILRKFNSWAETERTAEQCAAFLKQIDKARKLIKSDDPYAKEVNYVVGMLKGVKGKMTFDLWNTNLSGLQGLSGVLDNFRPKKGLAGLDDDTDEPSDRPTVARPYTEGYTPTAQPYYQSPLSPTVPEVAATRPAAPAPSAHPSGLPVKKRFPSVMSAHEVAAIDYPTYDFKNDPATNEWGTLFGQPQKPFAFMISGEPGAGKSTLMMQLAVYLAKHFGPTRYVSSEEYPSKTLADKLERAGGAVNGLTFSRDLSDLNAGIKFLIVDSTNHVKITLPQFLQLRQKYPAMSFGLIMQYTKDGQFKGGNEWPHEVDAVFRVLNSPKKGTVVTDKNRFVREPGTALVFKDLDD